jgi:glyoxylase-like metal-dependent hydrolase (beta-lactamase superfamily II)
MPTPLADGLWRWTARHPEWHAGEFGREVASLRTDEGLVLVDPLLPEEPGSVLDALDARAYAIGRPRRFEMPLHLPSHRALAFGDAVVETGGELRIWAQGRVDEKRHRFYRERFNPTLEPLLELDVERVLVTHGAPVLSGGAAELRRALEREPWILRG